MVDLWAGALTWTAHSSRQRSDRPSQVRIVDRYDVCPGVGVAAQTPKHVVTTKLVTQPAVTITDTVTSPPKVITKTKTITHTVTAPTQTVIQTVQATTPAPAGGVNPNDASVELGLGMAGATAAQKGDGTDQIQAQGSCTSNVNGTLACTIEDQSSDFGVYDVTLNGYSFTGTLDMSNSTGDVSNFPSNISGTFQPAS